MVPPAVVPPPVPPATEPPAATPPPALSGVDKELETLIDQRHAARERGIKWRRWAATTIILGVATAGVVAFARSPDLQADIKQAITDIRNGEMSVSKLVATYQRQVAKIGVRRTQIDDATRSLGVDPTKVKPEDPHMTKEVNELVGNFDNSGPPPSLELFPQDFEPGNVQMSLPPADDSAPTGEPPPPAAGLGRPPFGGDLATMAAAPAAEPPAVETEPMATETAAVAPAPAVIEVAVQPRPAARVEVSVTPPAEASPTEQLVKLWGASDPGAVRKVIRATTVSRDMGRYFNQLANTSATTGPASFNRGIHVLPVIGEDRMQVNVMVDAATAAAFANIRFKGDTDRFLNEESRRQVTVIADAMKQVPQGVFLIEEHNRDSGSETRNKAVSERRANRLVAELVRCGVPRNRLLGLGFGEEYAKVTDTSAAGRDQNRRVMIVRRSK